MTIPRLENIPELNVNYEGLKRHSHLSLFVQDPNLTPQARKLRGWFVHTVVSSVRHYNDARTLVLKQETADQIKDGGVIFYIFDVYQHLESCIGYAYRAVYSIHKIDQGNTLFTSFKKEHKDAVERLSKIRNQFEHMHTQIVSGQSGKGPIYITYGHEGKEIHFRSLRISTSEMHKVLKSLYLAACSFFPVFDPESTAELGGDPRLSIRMEVRSENG